VNLSGLGSIISSKGTHTMTAPEIIHQLVKRFDKHRNTYRSGKYNETQLRRELLDPFEFYLLREDKIRWKLGGN
jgi:hypothetical protein